MRLDVDTLVSMHLRVIVHSDGVRAESEEDSESCLEGWLDVMRFTILACLHDVARHK